MYEFRKALGQIELFASSGTYLHMQYLKFALLLFLNQLLFFLPYALSVGESAIQRLLMKTVTILFDIIAFLHYFLLKIVP